MQFLDHWLASPTLNLIASTLISLVLAPTFWGVRYMWRRSSRKRFRKSLIRQFYAIEISSLLTRQGRAAYDAAMLLNSNMLNLIAILVVLGSSSFVAPTAPKIFSEELHLRIFLICLTVVMFASVTFLMLSWHDTRWRIHYAAHPEFALSRLSGIIREAEPSMLSEGEVRQLDRYIEALYERFSQAPSILELEEPFARIKEILN